MANYKSKFTGQQIDDAVSKAKSIEVNVENPTEPMTSLKVGDTNYSIPQSSSGSNRYLHNIIMTGATSTRNTTIYFNVSLIVDNNVNMGENFLYYIIEKYGSYNVPCYCNKSNGLGLGIGTVTLNENGIGAYVIYKDSTGSFVLEDSTNIDRLTIESYIISEI